MQFDIFTLFPDIIYNYTDESILGRAQRQGLINVRAHNFREFSKDKQRHVDDKPYGGGPGMVISVEPIYQCLESMQLVKDGKRIKRIKNEELRMKNTKVIVMDPAGKKFDQRMAEKYSKLDRLVFLCGRYEGFDARIYKLADERVSVGNYVLAGGELPALTIVEAVSRLIPGVLGNEESLKEETHARNVKVRLINDKSISKSPKSQFDILHSSFDILREYPQYTRPENFMGLKVPPVLLSGDHKKIEEWRRKMSNDK